MDTSTGKTTEKLRAKLLRKGHTVRSFSRKYGFNYDTVHSAMRGLRCGPKSRQIMARIQEVTRGL